MTALQSEPSLLAGLDRPPIRLLTPHIERIISTASQSRLLRALRQSRRSFCHTQVPCQMSNEYPIERSL